VCGGGGRGSGKGVAVIVVAVVEVVVAGVVVEVVDVHCHGISCVHLGSLNESYRAFAASSAWDTP